LKRFRYSSVHLFDYISLALLIYSDLNLVALTSQPLQFSERLRHARASV